MSSNIMPSDRMNHQKLLVSVMLACSVSCSSGSPEHNPTWEYIEQNGWTQKANDPVHVDSVANTFLSVRGVSRSAGGEDVTLAYRTVRTDLDITEVVLHAAYDTPVSADVDGDGDIDIVGRSSLELWWLENLSNGRFWTEHLIDPELPDTPRSLVVYDVDSDGDGDLLVSMSSGSYWLENQSGTWIRYPVEMDDPRLRATMIVPTGIQGQPGGIDASNYRATWNVAGEGALEIACGGNSGVYGSEYSFFIVRECEEGDPIFTSNRETICPLNSRLLQIRFDDINGDQIRDIVACGYFSGNSRVELRWFEEEEDSSWTIHPISILPWETTTKFRTGDVDGDGDLDIVRMISHYGEGGTFQWLENVSSGQRWRQHRIEAPEQAYAMSVGDFDGDAAAEIVCFSGVSPGPDVFILEPVMYQSQGEFTSPVFTSDELVEWTALEWNSIEPEYTSISFLVRVGDSPNTLSKWSDTLRTEGEIGYLLPDPCSCFQYRAILETDDCRYTPVLRGVRVAYAETGQPCETAHVDTIPPFQSDSVPSVRFSGGSVLGMVLNEEGEPIPGAGILIRELDKQTSTDETGQFELDLEPGVYTIVTGASGAEFSDSVSIIVEAGTSLPVVLTPGTRQVPESPDDMTVTYESGETGIRGRVVGYRNTPLIGATVMVVGTSIGAMTDANGHYEILQLPVGSYTLEAWMVGMHKSTTGLVEVRRGYVAVVDFLLEPYCGSGYDNLVIISI